MLKLASWLKRFFPMATGHGLTHLTAGNIVTSLLGGFLWIIMAQIASAEDYGRLNYLLALTAIPSTVAVLGLNNIIIMSLLGNGRRNDDNDRILHQANSLILLANVAIGVLLLVIYKNLLLIPLFIFSTTYVMSASELLGRKLYKKFAVTITLQKVALLALTVVMYYYFSVDGAIVGQIVAAAAFSYNYFRSLLHFSFRFDTILSRLKFVINNFMITISQTLVAFLDKIVIGSLFSFVILGYYQLGAQLLLMINVIPYSLFLYFLSQKSQGKATTRNMIYGVLASSAIASLMIINLPFLMALMFPKFVDATFAIQIMLIGLIPQTMISIISSAFIGAEKARPILYSGLLYIVVLISLFLSLGNSAGLIGLAISSTMALATQAIALLVMNSKAQVSSSSQ